MTQTYLPSYPILLETVEILQSTIHKLTTTNKALDKDLKASTIKIAKLEKFVRDQNALLQEHGLAEYGN
jgi:hypothetical protein